MVKPKQPWIPWHSGCGFRQLPMLAWDNRGHAAGWTGSCVHGCPKEFVVHICTNLHNHGDGGAVSPRVKTRSGSKWFKIVQNTLLYHPVSTWIKIGRSDICIAHHSTCLKVWNNNPTFPGLDKVPYELICQSSFPSGRDWFLLQVIANATCDCTRMLLFASASPKIMAPFGTVGKVEHDWTHVGLEIVES